MSIKGTVSACERCGTSFVQLYHSRITRFCSRRCSALTNNALVHHAKAYDKFWSLVDKRGENECWEWRGAKTSKGYGAMRFLGKFMPTHRLSFILSKGEIPDGLIICHTCDNPPCCNPSHLWAGTFTDNNRDTVSKGRYRNGYSTGAALCKGK